LTHRRAPAGSFARNRLVAPLNTNHHNVEPRNTPGTSSNAVELPSALPAPRLAKIAAKERIVDGFASVSASVEA
jgi:hypothetical protein